MTDASRAAAPTSSTERYQILDVLRGFALLGVLIANLDELGGEGMTATAEQLAMLSTAGFDQAVKRALELFVYGKANTPFAILFGIGFWIQMERLTARGVAFGSIYLRRITILAVFGTIHMLGWFSWDILHLYGLLAFALYFSRSLSDRALLWIGGALLVLGKPVLTWAGAELGWTQAGLDAAYTETEVMARYAAAQSGDFIAYVGAMNKHIWLDWVLGGTLIAWFAYGLGRFYIGAWIARKGWIQNAETHLPMVKKLTLPLLLSGLGLQIFTQEMSSYPAIAALAAPPLWLEILHNIATPLIAAGYVCALIWLFFSASWKWLARPFAPVGQMALTNYLIQSPFILLLLTNAGPGLGLAGHAGSAPFLMLSLGFFAVQVIASRFWMKVFAYGPAEWVWRGLTYRSFPKIRRER
ncbi:MAG: DUF418 domain-containing protein [Henriciella sp.]|nr:DUF418 domain-containing protein [Henriciella sp.]